MRQKFVKSSLEQMALMKTSRRMERNAMLARACHERRSPAWSATLQQQASYPDELPAFADQLICGQIAMLPR